ncbi:hypothetical protein BN874_1200005 [Candidatus Contendobacter odensis Run_B_J11]|uniref:Uncharacterized protein n=2 Tax=Candidatus Contendobacter odensis Run_B_J11 TaxID=1400861 RepID=A0A7U7G8C6_9GAMM|nr:hypothetical protein BN874_1200005 [Candidatus Contendobacter odensis Run_B_J11]
MKQRHQQIRTAMDPTHKATRTQLPGQVPLFMEELVSTFKVSAKVQRGHQGRRQNLRVADSTLRVFPMLERFQQIITEAVNEYNLEVHRGSSPVVVE